MGAHMQVRVGSRRRLVDAAAAAAASSPLLGHGRARAEKAHLHQRHWPVLSMVCHMSPMSHADACTARITIDALCSMLRMQASKSAAHLVESSLGRSKSLLKPPDVNAPCFQNTEKYREKWWVEGG